jgi:hypothetical protein
VFSDSTSTGVIHFDLLPPKVYDTTKPHIVPEIKQIICLNHLFCRLARKAHANNPTMAATIPNPGVVVVGGAPIVVRAAAGSDTWLA